MRPAPIAVIHATSDTAPPMASVRRSAGVGSRRPIDFHAGRDVTTATFTSATAMAGNLMRRNGLPPYSVALVASSPMPDTAAITKPVVASGTVGPAIDAYVLGVLRRDAVTFPLFFDKSDASHADSSGLQAAIIANSLDGYKVTQPDGTVWIFSGRVQAMTQQAPVDGVQTAQVTIRPTGLFILNGAVVGANPTP